MPRQVPERRFHAQLIVRGLDLRGSSFHACHKPLAWNQGRRMSRAALIAMLGCLGVAAGAQAPGGEDGQWSMPSKDYAATRYSSLAGITAQNAGSLHPVWTFSTGVLGGHEGQPLVVGNT